MKYRKKPVVVEAMQYSAETCEAIHEWMGLWHGEGVFPECGGGLTVETLEGPLEARPGDWIIRGVKGEFYPCKPDIFEQTYEPVEED